MKATFTLTLATLENLPGGFVRVSLQTPAGFPAWRPGQFLSIRKTLNGEQAIRSYSIASLPDEGLVLLVRREPNGVFSRWIHDEAKPGDKVESLAPAGNFTLPAAPGSFDNMVLMAAGSGIAPIRPLLLEALMQGRATAIHLLYSATALEEAIFLEEFESLKALFPALHLSLFLSADPQGRANRLTNAKLEAYLETKGIIPAQNNLFYLCGPLSYRRMARFTLRTIDFGQDQVREENFDLVTTLPTARQLVTKEAAVTAVLPSGGEAAFTCLPHETILAAGLRQGVALPYSCRGGVCSSCTALLEEGKTHMTLNEILGPDDIARNMTLTCTALPASDRIRLRFELNL